MTITATCVAGDEAKRKEEGKIIEKRTKRESAVLIDSFPTSTYKSKPDIIYQRVPKAKFWKSKYGTTKPRYGPPKSKYGPPKPKYGPPKQNSYINRQPVKKYRRKPIKSTKYSKKKLAITKFGPVKKPYGPPIPKNRNVLTKNLSTHQNQYILGNLQVLENLLKISWGIRSATPAKLRRATCRLVWSTFKGCQLPYNRTVQRRQLW